MSTGRKKTTYRSIFVLVIILVLGIMFFPSGCGKISPVTAENPLQEERRIEDELTEGRVSLSGRQLAS